MLAAGTGGGAYVWQLPSGDELDAVPPAGQRRRQALTPPSTVVHVGFSANSRYLHDPAERRHRRRLAGRMGRRGRRPAGVRELGHQPTAPPRPDGKQLVTASLVGLNDVPMPAVRQPRAARVARRDVGHPRLHARRAGPIPETLRTRARLPQLPPPDPRRQLLRPLRRAAARRRGAEQRPRALAVRGGAGRTGIRPVAGLDPVPAAAAPLRPPFPAGAARRRRAGDRARGVPAVPGGGDRRGAADAAAGRPLLLRRRRLRGVAGLGDRLDARVGRGRGRRRRLPGPGAVPVGVCVDRPRLQRAVDQRRADRARRRGRGDADRPARAAALPAVQRDARRRDVRRRDRGRVLGRPGRRRRRRLAAQRAAAGRRAAAVDRASGGARNRDPGPVDGRDRDRLGGAVAALPRPGRGSPQARTGGQSGRSRSCSRSRW